MATSALEIFAQADNLRLILWCMAGGGFLLLVHLLVSIGGKRVGSALSALLLLGIAGVVFWNCYQSYEKTYAQGLAIVEKSVKKEYAFSRVDFDSTSPLNQSLHWDATFHTKGKERLSGEVELSSDGTVTTIVDDPTAPVKVEKKGK